MPRPLGGVFYYADAKAQNQAISVRLSPDFYKAKHKDTALFEIIRFTALKF